MKRHKLTTKSSKRNFSNGTRTHKKNLSTPNPMRGGIRL